MWKDLSKEWQEAFKMAWEAYQRGTIPIGCIITTQDGEIVSRGRNRIFDKESSNLLARSNMAHAEMTALFNIKADEHPDIRTYKLYTTLEPCPMCFGTMVMMNIRNIFYGGRDGFAGALQLNNMMDYIKNKEINIIQGSQEIEEFQLILQTAYEYTRQHPRLEEILDTWREVNALSIDYGKRLSEAGYFEQAVNEQKSIEEVYDEVIARYQRFKKQQNFKEGTVDIGNIVVATESTLTDWVKMGVQLWPDNTEDELKEVFLDILKSDKERGLLYYLDNEYIGFINVSIRSDYVNGSTSSPVGYVEGIYVKPGYRNRGIARELVRAGELWASNRGCKQMASDILIDNNISYDFHKKVGFDEVERVICFIKDINN